MKSITLGAVAAIIVGGGLVGCASADPVAAPVEGPEALPAGTVILHDDFDDDRNEWGIVDGEYGTAFFEDGQYVWDTTGSNIHWMPPMFIPEEFGGTYTGEPDLTNVTVGTELNIVSGEGVAGVFCRETPDTDAEVEWYEFVVRDGFASIRRADLEANIVELASTEDLSLPHDVEFTLEAVCGTGDDGSAELALLINGSEVLTASDADALPGPGIGQQAYTYPVHAPMTLHWNSFTVTAG